MKDLKDLTDLTITTDVYAFACARTLGAASGGPVWAADPVVLEDLLR